MVIFENLHCSNKSNWFNMLEILLQTNGPVQQAQLMKMSLHIKLLSDAAIK